MVSPVYGCGPYVITGTEILSIANQKKYFNANCMILGSLADVT